MSRLGLLLFRFLLLLGALVFLGLFAARQLASLMGATTFADGYRQLVERAPDWAGRLFSAPWWVPAAAAALPALLLIWPVRRRRVIEAPAPGSSEQDRTAPLAFEKVRNPPQPFLKDQHIYAGSAKFSMVPEFRAIPVRHIPNAKVYIEYSVYAIDRHRWGDRRRILVADVHDQKAGEWSVINVELLTRYENDFGDPIWRWAREFDYGPPEDESYLFSTEGHYQGRVVFAGPEDTVSYSYFAIAPSRNLASDMPNLISQHIFDFAAEWEAQDREEFLTI